MKKRFKEAGLKMARALRYLAWVFIGSGSVFGYQSNKTSFLQGVIVWGFLQAVSLVAVYLWTKTDAE